MPPASLSPGSHRAISAVKAPCSQQQPEDEHRAVVLHLHHPSCRAEVEALCLAAGTRPCWNPAGAPQAASTPWGTCRGAAGGDVLVGGVHGSTQRPQGKQHER